MAEFLREGCQGHEALRNGLEQELADAGGEEMDVVRSRKVQAQAVNRWQKADTWRRGAGYGPALEVTC